MVAMIEQPLLREYDDGPDWPVNNRAKEQAYRQGFVEGARHLVKVWAHPPGPPPPPDPEPVSVRQLIDQRRCDPFAEVEAAWQLRQRVRERFTVYGPGHAGRKTYHLGYRCGHSVAAARLRGRHHAMAYITNLWEDLETADLDIFDPRLLCPWLRAVEQWASAPIKPNVITPPPRPMDTEAGRFLLEDQMEPTPATSQPLPNPLGLRVDAVCLADVQPEPVRWLWPGRIALGKLSLIAGEPGLGKSFMTLDMAARVSRGDGWPCTSGSGQVGGVVLLSAEDDIEDTIVPRLIEARADRRRIRAMRALYQPMPGLGEGVEKPVPFSLIEHMTQLEHMVRLAAPCRLVIVDPVSAFLGSTDSHNNSEVRGVLAPLSEMAARYGVAVVAVTHLNKGHGSALNRVIGSIAFTAAARAAYVVTRDEDDPARRLMLPAKNNLGCDDTGFAYRLEGDPIAHVEWEPEPVTMSADEAVGVERRRGPEPDARRDAEDWLRDYLAAGPKPASEVFDAAKADGHSRITIKRAKAALKVESAKQEFEGRWVWILPGGGPVMVGGEGDHEGDQ